MSWDLRPFSEYFYEQAQGRKDFRFLFYCRNCVKNFDAPVRVDRCKFCSKENIVELPKDVWKRREIFRNALTWATIKAALEKRQKSAKEGEEKSFRESFFELAVKMRVAFYYYFDDDSEPVGSEEISQGDLMRSFQLV